MKHQIGKSNCAKILGRRNTSFFRCLLLGNEDHNKRKIEPLFCKTIFTSDQNKSETSLKAWKRKITINQLLFPQRSQYRGKGKQAQMFSMRSSKSGDPLALFRIFSRRFTLADHLHLIHYLTKPPESNLAWISVQRKTEYILVPLNKIKGIIADYWAWSQNRFLFAFVQVHGFLFSYASGAHNNAGCLYSIVKSITKDLIINNNSSPRDQRFCTKWWTHLQ